MEAYAMWSREMALLSLNGPVIIAANLAFMLGSKIVKEAFGVVGGDLEIGADILCRAALSKNFEDASGKYFDNDQQLFAPKVSTKLNESRLRRRLLSPSHRSCWHGD